MPRQAAPDRRSNTVRTPRGVDLRAGSTSVLTIRDRPNFVASTAAKAGLGAIGRMAMIVAGNKIVDHHRIEDPALWIGAELERSLGRHAGVRFTGKRNIGEQPPSAIAEICADSDYVLDVRTAKWAMEYFPEDHDAYRISYSAQMRLIDCESGRVVAEGFYHGAPPISAQSEGYDELLENGAAGLKRELRIAARDCLGYFRDDILKL